MANHSCAPVLNSDGSMGLLRSDNQAASGRKKRI